MMHTFRLLDSCKRGQVMVRRSNWEELLSIRSGAFNYDELLAQAEGKLHQIDAAAQASPLLEHPNLGAIEQTLVGLRTELYATRAY